MAAVAKGKKFANPMHDMGMPEEKLLEAADEAATEIEKEIIEKGPTPVEGPTELEPEEISDLTFAFEACDLDGGGTIDAEELFAVLKVFGAMIVQSAVSDLISGAKAGYKASVTKAKVKQKKNKKGIELTIDHPVDLNLPEFIHLMTSGDVDEYFPNGWTEGAYHMRLLKSAFATADLDGNNELEFEELATAINSLHTGNLSDKDIEYMWEVMNPGRKPFLVFAEFLEGMVRVQADKNLNKKFHLFAPDALMSLVLDTPVSLKEEKDLMAAFSMMEQFGMSVLERQVKIMTQDEKTALLVRAQKKEIHVVTETQRAALSKLHSVNVWQCLLAGFFSAACTAVVENILTAQLNTNGVDIPDQCWDTVPAYNNEDPLYVCYNDWNEPGENDKGVPYENSVDKCCKSPFQTVVQFWSAMGIVLGICCSFEIAAMYWYSIKNSVRVANAMELRLKPMNKDRSFVGGSLVRAALELGNSEGILFGVDPLRETSTKGQLLAVVFALIYVAKIAMSGFLIKVLIKRLASRGSAKFALPWAAVPATAAWNGFVGHVIMREAKLRGMGVAAAVEIFNTIVDLNTVDDISDLCRIQLCRAIGCNIVKQRDMYPTKEILLKHAVGNLGLVKLGLIRKDESGNFLRLRAILFLLYRDLYEELYAILYTKVLYSAQESSTTFPHSSTK
jgi:Ca2+-binding EF-hand superfamily protein